MRLQTPRPWRYVAIAFQSIGGLVAMAGCGGAPPDREEVGRTLAADTVTASPTTPQHSVGMQQALRTCGYYCSAEACDVEMVPGDPETGTPPIVETGSCTGTGSTWACECELPAHSGPAPF